jgi:proline dehydrogenase
MISFNNTEVAFKSKSDKDLKRAYRLFQIVGIPFLVKIGKPLTNFAIKFKLPIHGLIKRTIFKQFCGGENIPECQIKIDELANSGIGTILDYSVEGKVNESDFDATVYEIITSLDKGFNNPKIPFSVFKVTGICRYGLLERINDSWDNLNGKEQAEYDHLRERIEKIAFRAFERKTPVFIDAEESWIQDGIDRIAYELMEKYNREETYIYNTLQMYRHDRLDHLKQQTSIAIEKGYKIGIKLVRGAYMEKERNRAKEKSYTSPIQTDKLSTDNDFNLALEWMIDNLDRISFCAGTHNEESNLKLTQMMEEKGINTADKRIHFAQLLGMSDHISYNLANNNFNVGKYVPYGPVNEVLPYLLRRADENTSVAGQTSRELSLIIQETKRRKKLKE